MLHLVVDDRGLGSGPTVKESSNVKPQSIVGSAAARSFGPIVIR